MESNEKISENVMLIDVTYLNSVIIDVKKNFEEMLHRPLGQIDMSDLLVYLALDAGVRGDDNSIQVIFVYDKQQTKLAYSYPSDLTAELNNVAFEDKLGEFIVGSFEAGDLISRSALYLEFFETLADAEPVNRLILISGEGDYDDALIDLAKGLDPEKEVVQFRMSEPPQKVSYTWEVLAYPIMQALGIKGSELN